MSLSLVDQRLRLRVAGRNASHTYTNAQLDIALDRLYARFLRITRCVKIKTTVAFDASDNEADFSAISGFLATRIERARVDEDANYTSVENDLELVDAGTLLDQIECDGDATGTPTMIGFIDSTTAKLAGKSPSDDGSLTVVYSPLQTPWQLGTMGVYSASTVYYEGDVVGAASGATTLYRAKTSNESGNPLADATKWENLGSGTLVAPANVVSTIPDGLLTELIATGGPPMLQAVDPEHVAFTGPAFADYLRFEAEAKGIGSIGGKISQRVRDFE